MSTDFFSSNFYTFYMNSTMYKMATEVFGRYDKDKDGTITRDEFTGTGKAFDFMDRDRDGKINLTDIRSAFELNPVSTSRSNILENSLRNSFWHEIQEKDEDWDNALTSEEYAGEEVDFNRIDKNENGKITADEMLDDYLEQNPDMERLISRIDSMNMLLDALTCMGKTDFHSYF